MTVSGAEIRIAALNAAVTRAEFFLHVRSDEPGNSFSVQQIVSSAAQFEAYITGRPSRKPPASDQS